jgi:ATP-dependent Lhr-like helicase
VILVGVSDIVLMEDRSMLLRELHRKVLARALGEEAITEYQFEPEKVEEFFAAKFPTIASKEDILEALRMVGPMNLFREKAENIFAHSKQSFEKLRAWAAQLLHEGKVMSIWAGEDVYVAVEDYSLYSSLHQRRSAHSPVEAAVLDAVSRSRRSQRELADHLELPKEEIREVLRRLESAKSTCTPSRSSNRSLGRAVFLRSWKDTSHTMRRSRSKTWRTRSGYPSTRPMRHFENCARLRLQLLEDSSLVSSNSTCWRGTTCV